MSTIFSIEVYSASDGTTVTSRLGSSNVTNDIPNDLLGVQWRSVKKWRVEYEALLRVGNDPPQKQHRIIATSEPDKFYILAAHYPTTSQGISDLSWLFDPYSQEFVIKDGVARASRPFNRLYWEDEMESGEILPSSLAFNLFWPIVPVWPVTEYSWPSDSDNQLLVISDVIDSTDYHRLPVLEIINGEQCIVLERPGSDRIWLSLNKLGCIMQREVRNPLTGELVSRIVTKDISMFGGRLWLPTDFTYEFYVLEHRSAEAFPVAQKYEYEVSVLQFDVNDSVSEELFNLKQVPGLSKLNSQGEVLQTITGGEDLLDDFVKLMADYMGLPAESIRHDQPYLWIFGGIILGWCVGFFLLFPKTVTIKGLRHPED